MPAVSAQSPVPSGAGNSGTPLVTEAQPIDTSGCTVPSPAAITNSALITSGGGAGSPLVVDPPNLGSGGTLTGATYPGERGGTLSEAWPSARDAHGAVGEAPGGNLGPDCRTIDIPTPPSASGGPDERTIGGHGTPSPAPRPV